MHILHGETKVISAASQQKSPNIAILQVLKRRHSKTARRYQADALDRQGRICQL